MKFLFLILTFVAISTISSQSADQFSDVIIQKVERQVNAQTQLCFIETILEVRNEKDLPLNELYFAIHSESMRTLRLFIIHDNYDGGLSYEYKIIDNLKIKNEHQATLFRIELDPPMRPGKVKSFKLKEIHWGKMQPHPKQITITEDQKIVLKDSVYYFTPYTVLSQTTIYKLSSIPISFSDPEGKERGQTLEYIFPLAVKGFEKRPTRIHFENNTPFTVFKEVEKTIEVSHWGNIHIKEAYKLANEGAVFKGEYSRVDFSPHSRNTGKNALRALHAKYPIHTWGMHYRDEVGNISTSRAWREISNVNVIIYPRFAIFGGWSHDWEISYNLPTNHYLFVNNNDPANFVLKQSFGFPFENILAEKLTVKVILPEGSRSIQTDLPFEVEKLSEEKTFSYLDFEGRPTLIIEKSNALDFHNRPFTVSYQFDTKNSLIEPILLFIFFLVVFFATITIGRIDFSFKQKKVKEE